MLVSRRRTGGVGGGDARLDVELLAQMGDDPPGYGLSGADHPAGIAQRAQLQREAEPVVGAPPSRDMREVLDRQGVVPDDFRLAVGQGEHGVEPRPVDDGAPRHGQTRPSWSNVQLCRPTP